MKPTWGHSLYVQAWGLAVFPIMAVWAWAYLALRDFSWPARLIITAAGLLVAYLADSSGRALSSPGLGGLELDPLVRPFHDGVDGGRQRAALSRERVLHPHRRLGNDGPLDNPLLLQLLKALAQHPVGDVRDRVPEHREPAAPLQQQKDNRPRPPAADELARPMEARAQRRRGIE